MSNIITWNFPEYKDKIDVKKLTKERPLYCTTTTRVNLLDIHARYTFRDNVNHNSLKSMSREITEDQGFFFVKSRGTSSNMRTTIIEQ